VSFTSPLISSYAACIFTIIILHLRPFYNIRSLTNYSSNSWYDSLYVQKDLSITDDLHSLFHRKMYNPMLVQCHPSPIQPPVHPLSLTNASIIPLLLFSMNLSYRGSLTFHVPYLMSIFQCLGHAKEFVHVQDSTKNFMNRFFMVGRL
jgi:hypothetical protein